jgi:uncharacterized protein (DUF2252 family)
MAANAPNHPGTTREERELYGQCLRKQMPRTSQAEWNPKSRKHVPLVLLLEHSRGRLRELLAIKWGRMAASPFGYFRGAVPVMAADLAACGSTGYEIQIAGDAHVRNLGAFAVSDDRLVFDVNDFDETYVAPWEWDVKRMAASMILAGREADNPDARSREAVLQFVASYRRSMLECSKMTYIEVARRQALREKVADPVNDALHKAETDTPLATREKLTELVRGKRVFHERPPLLRRVSRPKARAVLAAMRTYRETLAPDLRHLFDLYRPVDVGFKVVGTGSVGVRDYVVLLEGSSEKDVIFLQFKEEPPSAYAPYVRSTAPPMNEGQRVVCGQRLLQAESDLLLGWTAIEGRDYLVRQLADHKGTPEPGEFNGAGLRDYASVCGEILAHGHARSGDATVLSGYMGNGAKFDEAVAKFAVQYADQTDSDHAKLLSAIKAGKLHALRGV